MIPQAAEELARGLRPAMSQDHDAVLEEWVEERGGFDPAAWLEHLVRFSLVPEALAARLLEQAARPMSDAGTDPGLRSDGSRRSRWFRRVQGGLRQTSGGVDLSRATPGPSAPRDERYTLVGTIGEGAMGRVELVEDRVLRRRVAYKRMADGLEREPALARRFANEVRITAQLDHPTLVPIHALDGDHAYTMKWVEGRTLASLLEEQRQLGPRADPTELLERFLDACAGVSYAHARGVLHRDLKPDNLMVGPFGETFVMDWGIALVFTTDVPNPIRGVTDHDGDLVVGTPGYLSPEQAAGRNAELGPASDQYALGLVLYEIVALRPAVTGRNATALVTRNQEGELDPLRPASAGRLSRDLAAIVARATAVAPENRYPDVASMANDVRRALRGQPVSVRPDGLFATLARRLASRAELVLVSLVIAVSTVTVLAVAALSTWRWQSSHRAEALRADQEALTLAAAHAAAVDGQLLRFEGLVSVVATLATEALSAPPPGPEALPPRVWTTADFTDARTAPPDAVLQDASDKYGAGLVSVSAPVARFAPGVDPALVERRLAALAEPSRRQLPRVLIRSHDERRAAVPEGLLRRTVLDAPIPARRASIAVSPGVELLSPGRAWPDLDPRETTAWKIGWTSPVPTWLPPSPPLEGPAVVTVVVGFPGPDGETAGVAALDFDAAWFAENLLLPEGWRQRPGISARLLDDAGHTIVSTDGTAPGTPEPDEVVLQALAARRVGQTVVGDTRWLHHRLSSTGWWSVIEESVQP